LFTIQGEKKFVLVPSLTGTTRFSHSSQRDGRAFVLRQRCRFNSSNREKGEKRRIPLCGARGTYLVGICHPEFKVEFRVSDSAGKTRRGIAAGMAITDNFSRCPPPPASSLVSIRKWFIRNAFALKMKRTEWKVGKEAPLGDNMEEIARGGNAGIGTGELGRSSLRRVQDWRRGGFAHNFCRFVMSQGAEKSFDALMRK